jgi:5-methylcytosine-specific restriction endonuclease McrA
MNATQGMLRIPFSFRFHSFFREYLVEKFDLTCTYCGKKTFCLQIDHIYSKSKGGSE